MPYSNNFYRQMYGYPLPHANLSPYELLMPYRSVSFCPYQQTYCPLLASMYFPPNRQLGDFIRWLAPILIKLLIDSLLDKIFHKKPTDVPMPRPLTQREIDLISQCGKNDPFRFDETEQCLIKNGMDAAMSSAVRGNLEAIFKNKMADPKITPIPGVSGNWKTEQGTVHFTATPELPPGQNIRGKSYQIIGEYDWGPTGSISGTLKDGVMTGEWMDAPTVERVMYFGRYAGSMYRQRSGRFRIEFKFDSNGIPTFSGTMGEGSSEIGTNWSGVQTLEESSGSILPPIA